jgi:probable phosphoglycerate mutase
VQVILVRHGEPEWSVDQKTIADPRLTERGRRQAELVAERLAGQHFDQVLVSPIKRAQQTAEPILPVIEGADPVVLPWLEEIRNPDWEGSPVDFVERTFAEQRLRPVEELWDGLPGGESFRGFHERVTRGLEAHFFKSGIRVWDERPRLYEIDEPDQRILVVAHGGVNAVTIGTLLGIPPVPWEWERFISFHASVTELVAVEIGGAHAFSLHRLSDLSHLPPDLHTY